MLINIRVFINWNPIIKIVTFHSFHSKKWGIMSNEKLYHQIDQEEEMTDEEKRETYFAEIENDEDYEEWENVDYGR